MRARSDRVGADFSVKSAPGQGTAVDVVIGPAVIAGLAATTGVRATNSPEAASIRDG
jgi:hypothetical protein